jgi:hypothetical protein
MHLLLSLAHLAFQTALVLASSALLYRRWLIGMKVDWEARLAWLGLCSLTQVVVAGLALGYAGRLTPRNLVLFHLVTVAAVCATTWQKEANLPRTQARRVEAWRDGWAAWNRMEKVLGGVLLFWLGLFLVTAVLAEPQVHDSLSYRLSRVGYWLQEHSLRHFATNEARQNYTPVNADLVMLWLTAPFDRGFPLVSLAQFFGGVLLMLAVWGLGRQLELDRLARLGSLLVLVGMPNVASQFTTSQTDLLTGGWLVSGLFFLLMGFKNRVFALPAWLGIGLAVGAKPTVCFWIPGLAVLGLIWYKACRPATSLMRQHLVAALLSLTLLGMPRYLENDIDYRNPFGAEAELALHGVAGSSGNRLYQGTLNCYSFFIQLFEPVSNPSFLGPLLHRVWVRLINALPEQDEFSVKLYPRREAMLLAGGSTVKNADTLSCGVMGGLLALFGALAGLLHGLRCQTQAARLWMGISASLLLFFPVFSALFLWWPALFRYFCLLAGFMALTASFGIVTLFKRSSMIVWGMLAVFAVCSLLEMYFNTFNAGFHTMRPAVVQMFDYQKDLLAEQAAIVDGVPDNARVAVLLPWNSVLAGFFRNGKNVRVYFMETETLKRFPSAEALLQERGFDVLISRPLPSQSLGANVLVRHIAKEESDQSPGLVIYTLNKVTVE